MFGGHFGLAEALITLVIFGVFTLFVGFLWTLLTRKPFRWKRAFIGMGALWLVLLVLSLFGC